MDKDLFLRYEEIRQSGKYNMLTDATSVMFELGLDPKNKSDCLTYMDIINNYSKYADEFEIEV